MTLMPGDAAPTGRTRRTDIRCDAPAQWGRWPRGQHDGRRGAAKMILFAANVNSAIWAAGDPLPDGDLNVEIDLQEYHQDNRHAGRQNVRSSAPPVAVDAVAPPHADLTPKLGRSFPPGPTSTRFHRYGLERRNGEVNLYFEGTLLRQLHREIEPEHREPARHPGPRLSSLA
ncbi:hypothetical protein HBB16_04625 [Pseudonocardia sp. MCCB 268]|nr:hypothetical protein [Pseudonocardia cytotoxica]